MPTFPMLCLVGFTSNVMPTSPILCIPNYLSCLLYMLPLGFPTGLLEKASTEPLAANAHKKGIAPQDLVNSGLDQVFKYGIVEHLLQHLSSIRVLRSVTFEHRTASILAVKVEVL